MEKLAAARAGARRLITEYLVSGASPSVLMVCDDVDEHALAVLVQVGREEGARVTATSGRVSFEAVSALITHHDTIVFIQRTKSLHKQRLRDAIENGDFKDKTFFRVFDFGWELLAEAFRVPRGELQRINEFVIRRARRARVATVRSRAGTDLRIEFGEFGWIDSCGRYDGRSPGVLPPAEVATYSANVEGRLVADGAVNTNLGFQMDPRLGGAPIILILDKSRVVEWSTPAPLLEAVLGRLFAIENGDRVGEVGFGTNIGLTDFVPFVSHINERFPALHIGVGAHNQGALLPWTCRSHVDFILRECQIAFDGTPVLRDYQYLVDDDAAGRCEGEVCYADTI